MKNFLYLSGPTGAGKTRLLRVMETTLAEKGTNGDVVRVGAERLVDEMVSELPIQGLNRFFARYAAIENLLVDNGWVLSRKPHAARMLARLFWDRRSGGKLTVVTSDLPLGRMDKEVTELFGGAVVVNLYGSWKGGCEG
jgi:chromosomal replication initiation ATPase DnaA